MHPELIPLSLEIQRNHYYHDEGVRKETINALIDVRRKETIIKEKKQTEFIFNSTQPQEANQFFLGQQEEEKRRENEANMTQNTSKSLSNMMTDIERFKERQKQELLKMIENELRSACLQQQKDLKMIIKKEKAKDKEYSHMQYQKEVQKQKRLYEQDKQLREEENNKKQKKAYKTYYQKEQQKIQKAKLKEQRHQETIKEKERVKKEKEEQIRLKALNFEKEKEFKINQREEEIKERERNKKTMQEYFNSQLNATKEQKRIDHEKAMKETKERADYLLKQKEIEYNNKQSQIEEQRKLNDKQKENIERMRIAKAKETEQKHKDMLEYNTIRANSKIDAFYQKEEEMNEKKKQTEYNYQRNAEARKAALLEKEKKANEAKEMSNYMSEQKKNSILNHLNTENEKTQFYLQRKEQQSKAQKQKHDLEDTEMKMNVKRTEQLRQYIIETKEEEMKAKNDKIMENRKKKEEEMNEKKRLLKIKEKKREKIQQEFDKIKSKNGALDFDEIKKLNPQDKDFISRIELLKKDYEDKSRMQIESYQRSKTISRQISAQITANRSKSINKNRRNDNIVQTEGNDDNNNSKTMHSKKNNSTIKRKRAQTAKKLTGNQQSDMNNAENSSKTNMQQQKKNNDEIAISDYPPINPKEKMTNAKMKYLLEQYQTKLNKDLLTFIEEKKKQNETNNKLFNEITNEKERRRLMTILKMERAQSSDKIGEYNKMIDVKLEEYKAELTKLL